jgi:hypothetical protein
MIRKSVKRLSEKIMLNQKPEARWRFNLTPSRFRNGNGLRAAYEQNEFNKRQAVAEFSIRSGLLPNVAALRFGGIVTRSNLF